MPIQTKFTAEKKEANDYPPIPKNIYQVELFEITDKTDLTYDSKKNTQGEQIYETVLNVQFVILEGTDNYGKSLRGRSVWKNFVPIFLSISNKYGKNSLYKIIEACIKRELTREEEASGITSDRINKLIGRQLRLSIEPKIKGDKTYDNIVDFNSITTDLEPLNEEEKENSKVKNKDNQQSSNIQQGNNPLEPTSQPSPIVIPAPTALGSQNRITVPVEDVFQSAKIMTDQEIAEIPF